MREITMFCSARNQEVRVLLTDTPAHDDGQASVLDSEIVCMEVGDTCAGFCPVCSLPSEAVDARVAKLGLRPEVHKRIFGHCDGCERETELVMSSGGYVSCTECGTTRRWSVS